jgi:hypothetical protein
MCSFISGLVVALSLSATAYAADVTLWEENPNQVQLWANFGTLLDSDSQNFGGLPPFRFEVNLVDEDRQIYAMPGQNNLGIVLADYIDAGFGSAEQKCEDEQGNLTVACKDMDNYVSADHDSAWFMYCFSEGDDTCEQV